MKIRELVGNSDGPDGIIHR